MRTAMILEINPYRIEVYEADRTAHDEPRTYAWEITMLDTPDHIVRASRKDYDLSLQGINRALQDAVYFLKL